MGERDLGSNYNCYNSGLIRDLKTSHIQIISTLLDLKKNLLPVLWKGMMGNNLNKNAFANRRPKWSF
jgi:hypothetical protein